MHHFNWVQLTVKFRKKNTFISKVCLQRIKMNQQIKIKIFLLQVNCRFVLELQIGVEWAQRRNVWIDF